jgi:hypothetical protein
MFNLNSHYRRRRGRNFSMFVGAFMILGFVSESVAQEIHSVSVDNANENIVVRGSSFAPSTELRFGGVLVANDYVDGNHLEIPFSEDLSNAAQWRGSYRLTADSSSWISVYISAPIPGPTPPDPGPGPGGPDCPCIGGWEASDVPRDFWFFCQRAFDGTQESLSGGHLDSPWFISIAHDPNNLFFDPADPGNSISYCAVNDGSDWIVAEPVTNRDQFDDCESWMWLNVCL